MSILDTLISDRPEASEDEVDSNTLLLVEQDEVLRHTTIGGISGLLTVIITPPSSTPTTPDNRLSNPTFTYIGNNQFSLSGIDIDADVFEWTLNDVLQPEQLVSGITTLVLEVPAASSNTVRGRLIDYDGKTPSDYVEDAGGEASIALDAPTVAHVSGVFFLVKDIDERATHFEYEINGGSIVTEQRPDDGIYSVSGVYGQDFTTVRARALGTTDGQYTSSSWTTLTAPNEEVLNPGEPETPPPSGTLGTPTLEFDGTSQFILGGIDINADSFVYTLNGGAEITVSVSGLTTLTINVPTGQENTLRGQLVTADNSLNPSGFVELSAGVNAQQLGGPFVEPIGDGKFIITALTGSAATVFQYQLDGGATITADIPPISITVQGNQGGASEVRARLNAPDDPAWLASDWVVKTQIDDPSIPGGGNEIF